MLKKTVVLAKKEKSTKEESTNFFKTYVKLSPKIKKVKKKEDVELLNSIVKDMNTLLSNLG